MYIYIYICIYIYVYIYIYIDREKKRVTSKKIQRSSLTKSWTIPVTL